MYMYLYIYIYMYICICMCSCSCIGCAGVLVSADREEVFGKEARGGATSEQRCGLSTLSQAFSRSLGH